MSFFSPRFRSVRFVAAGVLVMAGFLPRAARAFSSFTNVRWMISDGYVGTLLRLDPKDTQAFFDNPLVNIQQIGPDLPMQRQRRGGSRAPASVDPHPKIPAGWTSIPQAHYTSYAALVRDIDAGIINASSLPVLLYDDEKWPKTPVGEQRDPCQYMARFTKLAHAHGFLVNMAPDQNLAGPLVGITTYEGGESENWQSYLRLGLAACAARSGADRVHVMSQPFEGHWGPTPEGNDVGGEADFVNFVTQAALQAKAVNPKLLITCGLSTSARYHPTAEILYQESADVRDFADGFWLNLWDNGLGVAYLRLLSGPPPSPNGSVLFPHAGNALSNRMPAAEGASIFSLATPGATLTSETSRTYPAGIVIPAGAWEFQFWADGDHGSAKLGLEFGYRAASGKRTPIISSGKGWTPTVTAGALGAADAKGAFTTTSSTTLPPGGPYTLYWTVTVVDGGAFDLLYGSGMAPTNLGTPFVQSIAPAVGDSL